MSLIGKLLVSIGFDSSELQKGVKSAQNDLDSFVGRMKSFSTKLAGGVFALAALKKAFDFGKEAYQAAAQAEGVERAFNNLNKPDLLNSLRTATQGTVDDLELMQNAIQAKNFKIPLENLATYLKFAKQRADETGQSVDYLVQSIVLGVGRKSPLILDNLGISALETREEFAKTGDMAKAVANIIEREMGASNSTVATSKVLAEQAGAAWKNVMGEIGKSDFIKSIGDAFYNASAAIAENLQRIIPIVRDVIIGYVAYKAIVMALSIAEKARLIATLSGEAAMSIATKGVTYWKGIQYTLTLNLKKAQEALNIAMAKNPYGLIAMGIATAVFAISRLISAIGEETKAEKELREEQERKQQRNNGYLQSMAKEQIQVDILFGKLKSLKVGTSEYNDVKETIISRYGQYLKGLGEEITSLRNVEAAYKAISTAAVQAARDRALESATSEAAGKYAKVEAENLVGIRRLILEFNKGVGGEAIFESLKQSIRLGEEFTDEVKKAIGYTAGWMSETTVVAGSIIKRVPNVYELLIKNIQSSKKELDTETKEIEVILGGIFNAKAGKTYTKISELMTSLMQYQSELNNLNNKTSWSEEEEGRIGELNTSIDELKTKYKTLTGKEWGAKVKIDTDKDALKLAAEGSIAYLENEIAKRELKIKLSLDENERKNLLQEIEDFNKLKSAKLNIFEVGSEAYLKNQISEAEAAMIKLNTKTTEGKAKWNELAASVENWKQELNSSAQKIELQAIIVASLPEGSREKIQAKLEQIEMQKLALPVGAQEEWDALNARAVKLKETLNQFPKEIFPSGSLAAFDEEIARLSEGIDKLAGSKLAAARAAIALVKANKEIATNSYGAQLAAAEARLAAIKAAYENATGAAKEFWRTQMGEAQVGVNNLSGSKEVVVDFTSAVTSMMQDSAMGIGNTIKAIASGEGDMGDALNNVIIQPLANAAIAMGSSLIMMGVAALTLKTLTTNPWTAIAAGSALVALGALAPVIAQAAMSGGLKTGAAGTPGKGNTFTGGYSNGGSYSNSGGMRAASMLAEQSKSQVVVLETRVSGSDLIFVQNKEQNRRAR